nr:hypothetical protein [Lachnospiraceae bacterium]
MAWCPKCKNEYIDGITKCVDCGIDLVDELPSEEESKKQSTPIEAFLDREGFSINEVPSDIDEAVSYDEYNSTDADSDNYETNYDSESSANYNDDAENKYESESPEERVFSPSYVRLSDKYEDVKSSAVTLIFVGLCGIIFIVLQLTKVINIPLSEQSKWLFYTVMGGIFVAFVVYGIISYMHSIQIKIDAEDEDKLIDDIHEWFYENYTKDVIDSNLNIDTTDTSEELLYFDRAEYIKNAIMHQFENANE